MAEVQVQISTFVFLDFEATGLNNGKTKITELALLSVQREELMTPYGTPRVVNKLTLCVNPMKPISPRASEITGLYNENLESQSSFDGQVIDMIISYLTRLQQPVCLVAHYGNGFDFRLLASELVKLDKTLPGNIYCADSLEGFRELDGLPRTYVTPEKSPTNVTPTKSTTSDTPNKSPQNETVDKATQKEISTKSTTCSNLPSDDEVSASTSSRCFNYSTPVGQHILPDTECPGIKERARLCKRKSDGDLHTLPLKAKACRKRLFETDNVGDDLEVKSLEGENVDDKVDNTSENESGNKDQSHSLSETVNSKSDNLDVTSHKGDVKKKLDFEHSDVDNKSPGVENTKKCKEGITEQECDIKFSQSSIPDDILLDAVQDLEEKPSLDDNKSKNCSTVNTDVGKTDEKDKKWFSYSQVVVQCINTGSSYTWSKAVHQDKVVSYVTPSADHGCGPISSYETNHKHFRLDGKQKVTNITPKKDTESTLQKKYYSSENVNKKETKKTQENAEDENHGTRETIPKDIPKSGYITPVKSNQNNIDNTVDTPVSHLPPRLSYKLTEIYKRTFGHLPKVSHEAEDDCVALMKVIKKRSPEFLHWIDKNAVLFSAVKPL